MDANFLMILIMIIIKIKLINDILNLKYYHKNGFPIQFRVFFTFFLLYSNLKGKTL